MIQKMIKKKKSLLRRLYVRTLLKAQIKADLLRLGSDYGGYNVVKDALADNGELIIYSFGVGEDLTFSEAAIKRLQCEVYAFDPTPKAINYVKKHCIYANPGFHFFEYGISDKDAERTFYLPRNTQFVSGSLKYNTELSNEGMINVKVRTLKTIMDELGHTHIDVLKLDIEGEEFSVINNIMQDQISIGQICVEVHDRFFDDGTERLKELKYALIKNDYRIAYVSKNYEEITFVNMGWLKDE